MITAQLRNFRERVVAAGAISADDVTDLLRNVMGDGISTREEVEALVSLDRALKADVSWGEALKNLVVDFVVWGSRPTGYVTADDVRWLVSVFGADLTTSTARTVITTVADEAQEVDPALLALLGRGPAPVARELAA